MVDVRTRQQLWRDMSTGEPISKAAELAGTYDMPSTTPSKEKSKGYREKKKAVIQKVAQDGGMNPYLATGEFPEAVSEAARYHGGRAETPEDLKEPLRGVARTKARKKTEKARLHADWAGEHPLLSRMQRTVAGGLTGAGAGMGAGAVLKGTPAGLAAGMGAGALLGGVGGAMSATTPEEREMQAAQLEAAEASIPDEVLDAVIEQEGWRRAGVPPGGMPKAPPPEEKSAPPPMPPSVAPQVLGSPHGLDIRIMVPLMRQQMIQQAMQGGQPKLGSADEGDELLKEAFVKEEPKSEAPDDNEDKHVAGEQPASLPQAPVLKPTVDVSGKEPPTVLAKKEAQHYALPDEKRYPLDGYDQVKKASAYFDEWHMRMPPEMRRTFCQNMVKRASALGIPVSGLAERYGSDTWAAPAQVDICLDARRSVLQDAEHMGVLDKLASARHVMDADSFAVCLREFDKMAGIDHLYGDIPDPYFSTFGKQAQAKSVLKTESDTKPEGAILIGNEYITEREMVEFSKHNNNMVQERFGEEFAEEFAKDPMGIFKSLPRDQKLIMMRMANSSDSNTFGASTS